MAMKSLLSFFLFILSLKTLACTSVVAPSSLNMAIDQENKAFYFYNEVRMLWDRPDISLESCAKTAASDKYLMIAVALENFVLSDEFLTYSINDKISGAGEECSIKNNLYSDVQNSSDRRARLIEKRRFVNSCLQFSVTDFSEAGIDVKDSQPGCKITRVSKNSVNFEGPFCFIKPRIDSSIALTVDVKKECLDQEIFKNRDLVIQDVLGVLSLYTAGDDSGYSPDLTSLKQVNLRFSVNAPESLILTNSDTGEAKPLWPTQWYASDVYLSKPQIKSLTNTADTLKFPIVVNNRCERVCKGDLCTSSCDYSQPVIGEFSLYTFNKKGKKEYLTSWFDGGVAPANWQGVLSGVGVTISKTILEFGQKYLLEVDLSDQELNYFSFKGRIEKELRMNNVIGDMNHGGTVIRDIPMINTIEELNNLPTIKNIEGIYFNGNGFNGVQEALRSIELTFKNSFWPPYFSDVCNGVTGKCLKQSNAKNSLFLEFTLEGDTKSPVFSNVKFSRRSNIVPEKSLPNYQFPVVDCGGDAIPDIDMGDFDF